MKKVTIVGVGLIGGSLALCLKQNSDVWITGYDVQASSLEKAVQLSIIDQASESLREAVMDADFIFMCVPVGYIEGLIDQFAAISLKPGCIITDVGSTKQKILEWSEKLSDQPIHFIGGHPMAGSHKSGVEAATPLLFENAYYILTPNEIVPQEEVDRLINLLKPTGARTITLNPWEHDRIVGAISHLPHIVAAVLVKQVAGYSEQNDLYQDLAAGGFRDITRIASSNPRMWRDILLSNREVLIGLIEDWNATMRQIVDQIDVSNGEEIETFFSQAKQFRSGLPEKRKGAISPIYDLFLNVPDHPGIIARVTAILAEHSINLTNIQIIESREDVMGALRLSFRNEKDMDAAHELLKESGFDIYQQD
jgi:prephenate dehydrogenase